MVTRIDRLARSMRDVQLIVATLNDEGALSECVLEMKRADARACRGPVFGLTRKQAEEFAILARNGHRQAYRESRGAPLSERQRLRRADTEYADEQLIGTNSPPFYP